MVPRFATRAIAFRRNAVVLKRLNGKPSTVLLRTSPAMGHASLPEVPRATIWVEGRRRRKCGQGGVASMTRFSFSSLRARVALLVLLAVVPALGLALYTGL